MSEQAVFDALKYRVVVNEWGTRRYFNSANQLHRTDGPAVVYANGTKYWWQNGLRHRIDGPAVELPSGGKEWWINGKVLSEDDFNQSVGENV